MKIPSRVVLTLPLLLASFGCSSTSSKADAPPADGGKPAASKADAADEEAEKLLKKEHELEYARMELEIAKLSSAADEREADATVKDATVKLERAKKDRDNFLNLDKPTQVAEKQLGVDRSQQYMEEQRQEMAELEAMYSKEDFAALTKELVISRRRKALEFAQRSLDIAKKGQEELIGHELPKKEKELALSVEKAEKDLSEAQAKKERNALETKLKLMRSEHKVDEVAHEFEKMKKKSEQKSETKEAAA